MTEPIKLYFDEVVSEGKCGQTLNGEKVLYNLNLIDSSYCEQFTRMLLDEPGATLFLPCGRFIAVMTATLDKDAKGFMSVLDLNNNKEGAIHFAKKSPENYVEFMKAFAKIEYEKDYNKFILVEGEIPVQQDKAT